MARIRSIKPEFWTHEKTTACSRDARLLFIGLWNFADDSGRAHDSSRELKMRILPGDDDITSAHVEAWLDELANAGLIVRYEVEGKRYIQIKGWHHQKIQHPTPSNFPNPPERSEVLMSPHEPSLLKGREGKGRDIPPSPSATVGSASPSAPLAVPAPTKSKGSRLPSDWELPQPWRDWTTTHLASTGASAGTIAAWITTTAEAFKDHWLQSSRPTAVKRDWQAAWRVWVRKETTDGRGPKPSPGDPPAVVVSLAPEKRLRDSTIEERELASRVRKVCGKLTTDAEVAEWRKLDAERPPPTAMPDIPEFMRRTA